MAELTGDAIFGFTNTILASGLDGYKPTPACHREWWELCCSEDEKVAIAAPRNHAKTSAITTAYLLAMMLYRKQKYAIIISDTEDQASEFLDGVKYHLKENEDLIETFGVRKIIRDGQTDTIVEMDDGYQFRILAKGAEQKIRGRLWRGCRPGLIIGDDMENDEAVVNKDRRDKFRRWFFSAVRQALRDGGKIRIVGTILHDDSLLNRLIKNKTWTSRLYRAHKSFSDFSEILWLEKWPEARLREKRQEFIEENDAEGYAQEYLNDPIANPNAYFRKDDFVEMAPEEKNIRMTYYSAADFAISQKDRSDDTAIVTVGVDLDGYMYFVDLRHGQWDSLEIEEELFAVQKKYNPEIFIFETEKIDKALGPYLYRRMRQPGEPFLNIEKITPTQDLMQRARSIQRMHKAGAIKYNMDTDWFPELQEQMIRFPKATHDDLIAAFALIGMYLDKQVEPPTDEEYEDELYEQEYGQFFGHNAFTGYG